MDETKQIPSLDYSDAYIADILSSIKTIAIVGASANENRPSWWVMAYLIKKGFTIYPVNPGLSGKEILEQKVYGSLGDVPFPIDMVDVFRGTKYAVSIVEDALGLSPLPKVIWMQLGIYNPDAAALAEKRGLKVVMDRCPKIEYARLSGESNWWGMNSKTISSKKPLLGQQGQTRQIRKS